MKRQLVWLGRVSALLAVLCVVWWGLWIYDPSRGRPGAGTPGEPSRIPLVGRSVAHVQDITVTGQETYVIGRRGDTFVPDLGYPEAFWSQEKILGAVSAAAYLYVEKIDSYDNAAQYGLGEAETMVTVRLQEDASYTFYLGKEAPAGAGVYLADQERKDIYLARDKGLLRFLQPPLVFLDCQVMSGTWALQEPDRRPTEMRLTGRDRIQETVLVYQEDTGQYALQEGQESFTQGLDQEYLAMLAEAACDILGTEVLYGCPQERDSQEWNKVLEGYGLLDPYAVLALCWQDEEGQVYTEELWASGPQDGYCSLYRKGTGILWKVEASALPWVTLSYEDLFSALLLLPDIGEVERIQVSGSGWQETYLVGAGDEDYRSQEGRQIESGRFKVLYRSLLGIPAETYIGKAYEGDGEVLLAITWEYRDGRQPDVMELMEGPGLQLYLGVNGRVHFYTDRRYLDIILWNLEHLWTQEELKAAF